MSDGYWKTVYDIDDTTGKRIARRVWVPVVSSTSAAAAAAAARRKAQRLAAAKRRAAALAAAKRAAKAASSAAAKAAAKRAAALKAKNLADSRASLLKEQAEARRVKAIASAEARRKAFEALQKQHSELLRKSRLVIDKPKVPAGPARTFQDERAQMAAEKIAQRRQAIQNEQAAQQRKAQARQQSQSASYQAQSDYWRKRLLLEKLSPTGVKGRGGTKEQLTARDIKELEMVLAREAENSKGGKFDNKNVETLRDAYEKYSSKVYDEYEAVVAKANAAIDKYEKTGKPADYEKAKAAYAEYLKRRGEFQRLFGKGRNALKDGSYSKFYENYKTIGAAQREWWKSQMRAQLQKTVEDARNDDRPGRDVSEAIEAQEFLDILNGKIKTRQVQTGVDSHGRATYRTFTPEEEIAARQAEKIMEQERLRAEMSKRQRDMKTAMLRKGLVEYKGRYVAREKLGLIKAAEAVSDQFYGGKFDPARPHDIHDFVDKMLAQWEQSHPKPFTGRIGGARGAEMEYANRQWEQHRHAYENQAYEFFGLGPQGILEKGMDTPGLRDALGLLSAPFSAIGALGRVANKALTGENTIGGLSPTSSDVPELIKEQAKRFAEQQARDNGKAGTARAAQYMAIQERIFIQNWMKGFAGQNWFQKTLSERQAADLAAGREFAEKFYDKSSTDPLNAFNRGIEALNTYGSHPFQNEGANLLASLLLDPLNGIPLKFTTYGARGLYALDQAKSAAKFKPWVFGKNFIGVKEEVLDQWKHLRGFEKELTAKGMTRERFLDLMSERVLGTKTAAQRHSAIDDLLREAGFTANKQNETFLYNIAEKMVEDTAVRKGFDLHTAGDEAADRLAKAKSEHELAEKARVAAAEKERARAVAGARRAEAEAKAARSAEGDAYRAEKAAAERATKSKSAPVRVRKAGAAEAVAESPSPARTKPATKVDTASRLPPASRPARRVYEDAIAAVRRGETPLDPETGKPLTALSQDHAIAYLQKKMAELSVDGLPPPAPGMTRLYRGEGRSQQGLPSRKGGDWFSDDLEMARSYGDVTYVDVDATELARIQTFPKKPHEFLVHARLTDIKARVRRLEQEVRPEVTPPLASPLDPAPLSEGELLAEKLGTMSEAEWYAHIKAKMGAVLASKKSTFAAKKTARERLARIKLAEIAMEAEKKGGSYVSWKHRANFQKRVLKLFGKDVEGYIAPRLVAPFVQTAFDTVVEQARTYYKLLASASPVELAGAPGIKIKGKVVDFMPLDVFRELDRRLSAAISEARGHTADTVTRARASRFADDPDATNALGRMTDRDPLVIAAKKKALKQYEADTGTVVSMAAYDEARKVLWRGHVQNRTAQHLLRLAKRKVAASGGDLEKVYLELRDQLARREARKQLGGMAFGSHYGMDPNVILAEFVARYSDDGTIRHFAPELTAFQRKTLEANFAALSGVSHTDPGAATFLQRTNRPPFENRELTKQFLQRIGAWSPRTAEDFALGKKSWSIFEEADYWRSAYGEVPEWADVGLLRTRFKDIFHDQYKYFEQMKQWGIFSRSHELSERIAGKTRKEIEEAALSTERRSLAQQRKFVIERYGPLVSRDGKTLDAMPWLMHDDEFRRYLSRRTLDEMPEGFVRSEDELNELVDLTQKAIDRFWKDYIDPAATDGAVHYRDVFRLSSEVQAALLANQKWARRYRDVLGKGLDTWSWFNRWLVFSNPAFMVTNVVDAGLKSAYERFFRRGLFNRTLENSKWAADAEALRPSMFGFDDTPAIYRTKQLKARERLVKGRGITDMDRVVDRALAAVQVTGEIFPEISGRAELAMKMRLAKGMWPEVYETAFKRLGDAELARVASLDFIKKEINRLWPTAGDGAIERLWNRFVPFASYTVRNKIFWISEAAGNPVVLNHLDRIGRAIEAHNVAEWEKDPDHKGQPMPEQLRRLVQLPWAKDYFIDLSQFTDASRGLRPLYDTSWQSNMDRLTDWFRLVSPSALAGIRAAFNAFNLFPRTMWKPILDANGFPTGRYELVTVPWVEPWSKDVATLGSVFWFVDAIQTGLKYGIDGWDSGEASAIVGQVFLFNAIKTYDKMGVLFGWYKGLSKEDKDKFDQTDEGRALADWLIDKVGAPKDFKGDVLNALRRYAEDPSAWWHSQDPAWRGRVNEARDKIKRLRTMFAAEMYSLTPGSAEYREMKAKMLLAISDVYTQYPELMEAEVWSKSASQWAEQLQDWQTDKLMDDFMVLSKLRPQRSEFDSTMAYNKAVEDWEHQKQVFLATFPQVRDRLSSGILEVESVRNQIEQQWDKVLGRIAKRNELIDAAKAILAKFGRKTAQGRAAQERLDLLYLQNDLDYSLLERDYAATYFGKDDFERLPDGSTGPLREPGLLKRAQTFLDFDRTLYEKAVREGRLDEYLAKAEFGQAMKDATLYAKGGDPFGKFDIAKWMHYMQKHPNLMEKYFQNNPAKRDQWGKSSWYVEGIRSLWKQAGNDPAKWVRLLKADKRLLAEYFRRNPGKQAKWERMDSYIRHIAVWGKLVGAEKWDAANAAWDNLPTWVKEQYFTNHPGKREQFAQNEAYMKAIGPWGRAAGAGDWDRADAIWAALPQWVKDRYRANNPRKKSSAQTVQYLGYMKKWVSFFEAGKQDDGMKFFDSLPKWAKERYFKAHPENRLKFENNEKQNKLLREYFATDKQYRGEYLAKHPELKKWLAKNADSKEQERFAILQAYRTIPKEEAWLRRVFREKYPEIFSQEALGERKLKAVHSTLAKHGGLLPEFEKWADEILRTYQEMLKLGKARPLSTYFERDREEEAKQRSRMRSRSAAEVSA